MHCDLFRTLLDDRKDGHLTDEQLKAMDEHLAVCPRCRAFMQMQDDLRLLAADEQVPSAFRFSWQQAVQKEMCKKRLPAAVKSTLAAAAAVLFLVGGTVIHRESTQQITAMDSAPMMMRAMPSAKAAEPALQTQFAAFLQDMGAFLLDVLPYLGALAAAALLLILLKKRKG